MSDVVDRCLRASGWTYGRDVPLHLGVRDLVDEVHLSLQRLQIEQHPASSVLREFAGLHVVPEQTRGVECAPADVMFAWEDISPFEDIEECSAVLGSRLRCVGSSQEGYNKLLIDTRLRVFSYTLAEEFIYEGTGVLTALDRLLRGLRGRPVLLPGQLVACVWGEDYSAGDPRVFNPDDVGSEIV